MTLRIEVQGLTLSQTISSKVCIQARGTRSGHLVSEVVDLKDARWDPYFRIDCNRDDHLALSLVKVGKHGREQLGSCSLICSKLIKENTKTLSWEYPMQYALDIVQNEQIKGAIKIWIRYDPTILFQGELPSKISLSLSGKQSYPIYQARTSTVNAFSFLDQGIPGQYCQFTESIYRDHS